MITDRKNKPGKIAGRRIKTLRRAVLFGTALLLAGGTVQGEYPAAETETDKAVETSAPAPDVQDENTQAETASQSGSEDMAESIPDPSPETGSAVDTTPEAETAPQTESGDGGSNTPMQQESESHSSETEPDPAAEKNHSRKIPENPTEDMAIRSSDIVDAKEEYWESQQDETETIEIKRGENGEDNYSAYGAGISWDPSWCIASRYRFRKIDKVILLSEKDSSYVYEKPDKGADIVGKIPQFGIAYLLQSEKDGWAYIESGDVRGFARTDSLLMESDDGLVDKVGEDAFAMAVPMCEKPDNEAYTYTMTTVHEVRADKEYALMIRPGGIYEYADETSRKVGEGESGSVVFILSRAQNGWLFVESGDVRGFIDPKNLVCGSSAQGMVENAGEESFSGITQMMEPEKNRSFYFTLSSTQSAAGELGQEIAEYAASYVGRLGYVWGGCSLESGCDCSGFVLSIYRSFGLNLPRLAQEIGISGREITNLSDAMPGDVIYWGSNPHVGIYLGNGKVVQCQGNSSNTMQNPGQGPTISDATYMPITSIRRFLTEEDSFRGEGGNRKDNTAYSQKDLELIWAIVAQEDNGSYEGAVAVITSAMNRTESAKWGFEGSNALLQLTAPGQYCYSNDSYWIPRLNGNVPDYVKKAVDDCLNHGIRNHSHTSFRSTRGKVTGNDAVQVGGNWYFDS